MTHSFFIKNLSRPAKQVSCIIPHNMFPVTSFIDYLSKKSPKINKEHLAFYNYLRYFCYPEQRIDSTLLQDFYRKSLLFPHWQNHYSLLQQSVIEDIRFFAKTQGFNHHWQELVQPRGWQIIKIQNQPDLLKISYKFLNKDRTTGDQLKVLPYGSDKVLSILLKFDGSVQVCLFGPLACIHEGQLEPLTPLSQLYYLSNCQLHPSTPQILEENETSFIRFQITNKLWKGGICRGPYFQQSEHFAVQQGLPPENVFYRLKQLEHTFIQPESDPHYQQLIQSLHRHYRHLLVSPRSYPVLKTNQVLSQARHAIKSLYPNNRLLILLTANIEFHAQKYSSSPPQSQPASYV